VGLADPFFEIGGHSLMASNMIAKLEQTLNLLSMWGGGLLFERYPWYLLTLLGGGLVMGVALILAVLDGKIYQPNLK
jgi:hypothetical protein